MQDREVNQPTSRSDYRRFILRMMRWATIWMIFVLSLILILNLIDLTFGRNWGSSWISLAIGIVLMVAVDIIRRLVEWRMRQL